MFKSNHSLGRPHAPTLAVWMPRQIAGMHWPVSVRSPHLVLPSSRGGAHAKPARSVELRRTPERVPIQTRIRCASCGLGERHFVLGWRTALRSLTVLGRPQSDFSSPPLLPPRPAKIQRTLQGYITMKYSLLSSIGPELAYSVLQSNGHVPRSAQQSSLGTLSGGQPAQNHGGSEYAEPHHQNPFYGPGLVRRS